MNATLERNQVWIYRGRDGAPMPHLVLDVDAAGVTTIAPLAEEHEGIAGWMWYGPIAAFLKDFVPMTAPAK